MDSAQSQRIASDLVRALRGRRSRAAFSRALGFRSNVVHRWEAGSAFPAAETLLCRLAPIRPEVRTLFARFWGEHLRDKVPSGASHIDDVAGFLRALRGRTPVAALVERTPYNRHQISRWLSGRARPLLPEFLALVEAQSRRLLDLLSLLVDPASLPSVAERWQHLCAAREAAYEAPFCHAVLRALELESDPRRGQPAYLAERLGVAVTEVEAGLGALQRSGQIRRRRGRYVVTEVAGVDTRQDPVRARGLKAYWGRLGIARLEQGTAAGTFGYSLFAISQANLARLQALQLDYVRAMQNIIAEPQTDDCVGLFCSQLLDLAAVDAPDAD